MKMLKNQVSITQFVLVTISLFAIFFCSLSMADSPIVGNVAKLKGQLTLENVEGTADLSVGNILRMQDTLRTSTNSRADLRFLDGSLMTLGDNAVIMIDKLIYNPENNDSGGVIDLIQGAFHFVSGKISKTENSFTISTPTATIGIRGTDFIVTQSGENMSVLLLDNGIIHVSNSQGSATLDQPGQGVDIKGINGPIGDVKNWTQERKDETITSVSW